MTMGGARPKSGPDDKRGAPAGAGTIKPEHGGQIGQPPFVPTPEQREQVLEFVAVGLAQKQIIQLIKHPDGSPISLITLQRHFREELDTGGIQAIGKVGGAIFRGAMAGNPALARLYWNINAHRFGLGAEQRKIEHSGLVKTFDLTNLTPEQRKALLPVIDQLLEAAEETIDDEPDDATASPSG